MSRRVESVGDDDCSRSTVTTKASAVGKYGRGLRAPATRLEWQHPTPSVSRILATKLTERRLPAGVAARCGSPLLGAVGQRSERGILLPGPGRVAPDVTSKVARLSLLELPRRSR
jgi:hypothetical protein